MVLGRRKSTFKGGIIGQLDSIMLPICILETFLSEFVLSLGWIPVPGDPCGPVIESRMPVDPAELIPPDPGGKMAEDVGILCMTL